MYASSVAVIPSRPNALRERRSPSLTHHRGPAIRTALSGPRTHTAQWRRDSRQRRGPAIRMTYQVPIHTRPVAEASVRRQPACERDDQRSLEYKQRSVRTGQPSAWRLPLVRRPRATPCGVARGRVVTHAAPNSLALNWAGATARFPTADATQLVQFLHRRSARCPSSRKALGPECPSVRVQRGTALAPQAREESQRCVLEEVRR
jgi:hypothetical protein